MNIDVLNGQWINKPKSSKVDVDKVEIITDPETDFWQRSYYGFRNDNAPALLMISDINFTFTTNVAFNYKKQFDQCGLIIYADSENWFKAAVEYENDDFSRLGSVVTNNGHSDWATTDIDTVASIWFRLSRRGPDFLIESSFDGIKFQQMRIFHLHCLGETSVEMGQQDPPIPPEKPIRFGLYACSPVESSFAAVFSKFIMEECLWKSHVNS